MRIGRKNPPFVEPAKVYTRNEIQALLRKRIEAGDKKAERLWAEYRRADRLLDRLREKPLYPTEPEKPGKNGKSETP